MRFSPIVIVARALAIGSAPLTAPVNEIEIEIEIERTTRHAITVNG